MRAPLTSTHRQKDTGICFRVNNELYADQYVHGKWFQSSITNEEILITDRFKYITILHTGFDLVMANLFQWSIGSVYRVKKIKIY